MESSFTRLGGSMWDCKRYIFYLSTYYAIPYRLIRLLGSFGQSTPYFTSSSYSVQVNETALNPATGVAPSPRPPNGFLIVQCINRLGSSAGITYTVGKVSGFFPFALDSTTGSFSVTQDLDYEMQPHSYSFSVECSDNLSPALSGSAPVVISVLAVNEYLPVVSPSYFYLPLGYTTPVGTVLAYIQSGVGAPGVYTVTDADVGADGVITFSLHDQDPHFTVDSTGSLYLEQSFEHGVPQFYDIKIKMCDPDSCTILDVYLVVSS